MQQSVYSELYRSASSDDLTGLFTRKYLFEVLGDEFSTSIRRERPLSMMMLDIDYFKKINDTYGHPVGDEILTHIAKLARSCFREKDHLARYGGEEFAAVCPGLGGKDAARVAERIRKTIEDTFFECGENQIQATVSIGIATLDDIPHDTPKRLLEAADQALYHAKSSGRNMVVRFEETQERQAELDEDEAGQSES
jgi:diguanylate cyclase (GGDEF)-like protein